MCPLFGEVLSLLVGELLHHLQVAVLHHVALTLVQLAHQCFDLEEGELTHVHVLLVVALQVILQTFVVLLQKLHRAHLVLLSVNLLQALDLILLCLQFSLEGLFSLAELSHQLRDSGTVAALGRLFGLIVAQLLFEFFVPRVLLLHYGFRDH